MASRKPTEQARMKKAVQAVRDLMRSREASEALRDPQGHQRIITGASFGSAPWFVSIYGRTGYRPNYHVRRTEPDMIGSYYALQTGSAQLATMICLFLNAWEAIFGGNLAEEFRGDG